MNDNTLVIICIPTYKIVEFLEKAVCALAPKIIKFKNSVRIIISDNFSTN